MSSSYFKIVEHTVPCQHIREYPNALKHRQEDVSSLAIKQYIPLDNLEPEAGAVTIIAGHANGFPKVYLSSPKFGRAKSSVADADDVI